MNEQVITMIIAGDGTVEIETTGFTGKVCEKTASKIITSLNGTVEKEEKKPEYWEDGDSPVKVLQSF